MTRDRRLLRPLIVALLFFAAPSAWLILQQGFGAATYFECTAGRAPWGPVAGAVATAICVAAAIMCWRRRDPAPPTRRFLMLVGAGSAAIFATAALALTAALVLAPACAR
jgi:hypothetical protein